MQRLLSAPLRAVAVGGSAPVAAAPSALGPPRRLTRARAQALASRLMGEQLAACLAAAGAAATPAAAAAAGPRLWARCRAAALAQELAAFRGAGGRAAYARAAAGARACASFLPPEPDPARARAAAPAGGRGARPTGDAGDGAAAGRGALPAGTPAAAAACGAAAARAAREARACGAEPPRKRARAAPAPQGGAAPQQSQAGGAGRAPAGGVLLDADIDWDAVGAPDAGCVSGGSGDDPEGPPAAHAVQAAEAQAGQPASPGTAGAACAPCPNGSLPAPATVRQAADPAGARAPAARALRTPRLRTRGGADVSLAPAASTPVGDLAASMRLARSGAAAAVPGGARDGGGACALPSDWGECEADTAGTQGGREPLGDGSWAECREGGAAAGEPEAGPGAYLAAHGRAGGPGAQEPEQPRQRSAARSERTSWRAEAGGRGGVGRVAAAGAKRADGAGERGLAAAAGGAAAPCAHLPAIRGFVRALLDPLYEAGVRARPRPAATARAGAASSLGGSALACALQGAEQTRTGSGWLGCAKLVLARPPSARLRRRAAARAAQVVTREQYKFVAVRASDKIARTHAGAGDVVFLVHEADSIRRLVQHYIQHSAVQGCG
jgi:hypothetical protein